MAEPAFMFHKQTGMRYAYAANSPMLKNPSIVLLDAKGQLIEAEPAEPPKRQRRRKPKTDTTAAGTLI